MKQSNSNYYEILEIPRNASEEQINRAFREKAKTWHPDKNPNNPDASRHFKMATQAYQTLMDPARRAKYNATLPTQLPTSASLHDIVYLWKTTGEIYFQQSERFTPAIDALRESVPIVLEDEAMLIIGVEPRKTNLIGYLQANITHNHIRRILNELTGKPLDFRLISGTSLEDWKLIKEGETIFQQKQDEGNTAITTEQKVGKAPLQGHVIDTTVPEEQWSEVMETLVKAWGGMESRSFPQSRARYLLELLPLLARAEDASRIAEIPDDLLQRYLARAIDRLASLSNIDSGIVALEYLRLRNNDKSTGGLS